MQAEVGCLTFLLARNTHPLCYLQAEVGRFTFLLARKHIPSATCRQKLAALPSYWPGTHITSAKCRQKLAALPSCWLGNTSLQLPADISWLSYSAIHKAAGSLVTGRSQKYWRQEWPPEAVAPFIASQMEWWNGGIVLGKAGNRETGGFVNSAVTFLLARKHIPSATCRQKLASFALDSCPSSQEGRRMLKSSPTNQHIFSKKTFQLKINGPREMAPEITPKGHWTWDSTGYGRQAGGTHPTGMLSCYRPQRSCGQGNIFAPVCHSVHRGEGVSASVHAGIPPPPQDQTPPAYGQRAAGTHPTGMHSC